MMSLALIASFCSLSQISAADYFPLSPGMKWDYETTGDGAGFYSQVVGGSIDIEGTMMAPINIIIGNKVVQTTFYRITPGGVHVLGSDPKAFLATPHPVFVIEPKGAKWSFEGPSPYEGDTVARMRVNGQSKAVGPRTYLGEKRDCLEVKTETKIGLSEASATVIKHTAIYAKGLGLAELDETIQQGKRHLKRQVKLIKFEATPE
jgi:hypothetical protein